MLFRSIFEYNQVFMAVFCLQNHPYIAKNQSHQRKSTSIVVGAIFCYRDFTYSLRSSVLTVFILASPFEFLCLLTSEKYLLVVCIEKLCFDFRKDLQVSSSFY